MVLATTMFSYKSKRMALDTSTGNRHELKKDANPEANTPATEKTESEKRFDRGTPTDFFATAGKDDSHPHNDVATNDGSVLETLDTAFHDKRGHSEGENLSGSNRADYYEARSNSRSETEEELEVRKKRPSAD